MPLVNFNVSQDKSYLKIWAISPIEHIVTTVPVRGAYDNSC